MTAVSRRLIVWGALKAMLPSSSFSRIRSTALGPLADGRGAVIGGSGICVAVIRGRVVGGAVVGGAAAGGAVAGGAVAGGAVTGSSGPMDGKDASPSVYLPVKNMPTRTQRTTAPVNPPTTFVLVFILELLPRLFCVQADLDKNLLRSA